MGTQFLRNRIGKIIDVLDNLRKPESVPVGGYSLCRAPGWRGGEAKPPEGAAWEAFGGGVLSVQAGERIFLRAVVVIPENFAGRTVGFSLPITKSRDRDDITPQILLSVDGVASHGMDGNHTDVVLFESAAAGKRFELTLTLFGGDRPIAFPVDSRLFVLDAEADALYHDLATVYGAASLMDEKSDEYIELVGHLNDAVNLLDFRREGGEEFRASVAAARERIAGAFGGARAADAPVIDCVGHTHIDVVWLWTLAVTRDKTVRSFATVADLMRRYPEYKFMSSQPQLYQFVKEDAPDLYGRIRELVREGRWETDGGMWVEADCNLASGEALVRQFTHGIRFFREEFGVDCEILWLPDVFGYSAALPQIMRKCGIRYFMTTKISWNDTNKLPYDTFQWEGIDGSRVLTHFITARDYNRPGAGTPAMITASDPSYRSRTDFFTTYNGELNPSQILGGWQRYQQKHLNRELLFAFGFGDGGGGPTAEMLETQRRLARGIPGMPRTEMRTAREFFHGLEADVADNKRLPAWVGELYLEYHRGTYTSMARTKRYNRRGEFACQNAEIFGVLASLAAGAAYPAEDLEKSWKTLLLNQFHDILPGSSIKEVYEESRAQYEELLAETGAMQRASRTALAEAADAPAGAVVVFNPNEACARAVVRVEGVAGADSFAHPVAEAVGEGNTAAPAQKLADGSLLFSAADLPGKGYASYRVREGDEGAENTFRFGEAEMENKFFHLRFDEKGRFSGIFDKRAGREVLAAGTAGNRIVAYEDRPHNYDAWDINDYYEEKSWEVGGPVKIEVIERGPVRACVRLARPYLDSRVDQYIYLYRDLPRIDIRNVIDWHERHQLVKCEFDFAVHANAATFDIQFGNVVRPTHRNTSWDAARFEVCVHKWLDIAEEGYGVAVLNDCKYGVGVHGSSVGLTMLKCATYPNPDADREVHEFTYSLMPHAGGWREAGVAEEAFMLSNPPVASVKKSAAPGGLPSRLSLVAVDAPGIVVDAVKFADDGSGDVIVRAHECRNRRVRATFTLPCPAASVADCDLLERPLAELLPDGASFACEIMPYEIKTFRIGARTWHR